MLGEGGSLADDGSGIALSCYRRTGPIGGLCL